MGSATGGASRHSPRAASCPDDQRFVAVARAGGRSRIAGRVAPVCALPPRHAGAATFGPPARAGDRGGPAMTFDRPWALLVMLMPLAWAAWEWRRSRRHF